MNYELLMTKAKEKNISDIEIYAQHKQGLDINLFNGKIDKFVKNDTKALAIRGLYENKMGYVSVENLNDSMIDFILDKLVDNANMISSGEESFIYEGSNAYAEIEENSSEFIQLSPEDKINLLKRLEEKVKSLDDRITDIDYCLYQEGTVHKTIQNSKGLDLSNEKAYILIYVSAVAKEGEDVKSHGDYIITNDFNSIDIDTFAEKLVKRAVSLLNAKPVPSKKYPVIFENKMFADLLGAFEPMFSGESAVKGLTLLSDKVGEQVAGENINLIDNPLFADAISRSTFDDEGVACQPKEVITNGTLRTLLHNLKTAKKLNVETTGNGFKAGVNSPVGVSAYNLYLEPGTSNVDEMISGIEEGLFITSISGLHAGVDAVSGSFSVQSSGFLIEGGKIVRPVNLIVVAGNFLTLLNEVELIGDDLSFNLSNIGSPSIKVKGLTVSGI